MKRSSLNFAKGQVSLFVIMALIVLAIIAFAIFINTNSIITRLYATGDVETIKEEIQECIKFLGEEGLIRLGNNAGQLDLSIYMSLDSLNANYLYYNEESYLPTLEQIQDKLSAFIDENVASCTNLDKYKKFNISVGSSRTRALINNDKVSIMTIYPVEVWDGEDVYKLNEPWNIDFPVRMAYLHKNIKSILDEKVKYPEYLFLNESDLKITYFKNSEGQLYIITDPNSLLRNQAYKFVFAVKP